MVDRVAAFVDDASARAFRQEVFDDVDVLLLDGQHQRGATLDVDGVQISESIWSNKSRIKPIRWKFNFCSVDEIEVFWSSLGIGC